MNVALGVPCATLVVASFAPLARMPQWWVRGWEFPRLQISALLALALGLVWLFLDAAPRAEMAVLALLCVALAYQLWWIVPYSPCHATEVADARDGDRRHTLRLLASNVLMTNRRADLLLALVRQHDPDVLVAVETDRWWEAKLDTLGDRYPTLAAARCRISMA